jgi:hypothetical protein
VSKRDLVLEKNRPDIVGKETWYCRKRDLVLEEKRPDIRVKETWY